MLIHVTQSIGQSLEVAVCMHLVVTFGTVTLSGHTEWEKGTTGRIMTVWGVRSVTRFAAEAVSVLLLLTYTYTASVSDCFVSRALLMCSSDIP